MIPKVNKKMELPELENICKKEMLGKNSRASLW